MQPVRSFMVGVIVSVIGTAGCATLSGGMSETVTINSTPAGAKVTIDGVTQYTTPASVSLARKKDHIITVEKDGYKKATLQLGREFRGMSAVGGNVLWLLPGVIVDAASGGMYEFKEKNVEVTLEPEVPAGSGTISQVK